MPEQNLPRITVITPSLNQAEYLERAICSVLDQGYENLEYIVMDGGSSDNSAEIISLYEDDLAFWQSAPDEGPADAINQAIQRATGDIIAILNADDIYLSGTLDSIAEKFRQSDAPAWVVGHCLRIGEMDEQLGQLIIENPKSLEGFLMQDAGHIPASASFYSRSLIEAYGWFDPQLKLAWCYEYHCRLISQGLRPQIVPALIAAHREHAHSMSAKNTLRCGAEFIDAAARYADRLTFEHRSALWAGIDERRRIYDLARTEMATNASRRNLWKQLLRQPWWLGNHRYRQTLMRGVTHPASLAQEHHDMPARRAA